MKMLPLSSEVPNELTAYEIEPGKVLFVLPLPRIPAVPSLSNVERKVLELLLDGHDTGSIADLRGRSPRTVGNQIASVFKKIGVSSRAELAAKLLTRPAARPRGTRSRGTRPPRTSSGEV